MRRRKDDGPRSFGWNRRDTPFPLAWLAFTAPDFDDRPPHTDSSAAPAPSPERRLYLAHLELAWRDATRGDANALTWFATDDPSWPASFTSTAAILGLEPQAVRRALAARMTTTATPPATTRRLTAVQMHIGASAHTGVHSRSATPEPLVPQGLPHPSKMARAS